MVRGIERKVAGRKMLRSVFSVSLSMARRIMSQRRHDKNKVYSIHALEVECIARDRCIRSMVWL